MHLIQQGNRELEEGREWQFKEKKQSKEEIFQNLMIKVNITICILLPLCAIYFRNIISLYLHRNPGSCLILLCPCYSRGSWDQQSSCDFTRLKSPSKFFRCDENAPPPVLGFYRTISWKCHYIYKMGNRKRIVWAFLPISLQKDHGFNLLLRHILNMGNVMFLFKLYLVDGFYFIEKRHLKKSNGCSQGVGNRTKYFMPWINAKKSAEFLHLISDVGTKK